MEGYGNILTIFEANAEKLAEAEHILAGHTIAFERVENVLFLLIPAVLNAPDIFADLAKELSDAKLKYAFYYIALSDRSILRTKGLPQTSSAKIRDFLIHNN